MKVVTDFTQGKMNMDVDSKLMPKGEYRYLKNARVIDSDGSNSGVVESISGTELLTSIPLIVSGFKVIRMYAKDEDLFYFLTKNGVGTVIGRYKTDTKEEDYLLIDLNLNLSNQVDGYLNTLCAVKSKDNGSAFSACANLGWGWYLPSSDELKTLLNVIPSDTYWSSTEYGDMNAYMSDRSGNIRYVPKETKAKVVAIRKFFFDKEAHPSIGTIYREFDTGIAYEYKILEGTYEYGKGNYYSEKMLPFTEATEISGVHLYKDLLIFHDKNQNAPYKINIKRTLKDLNHYGSEEDLMVIKEPPAMPSIKSYSREGNAESFQNVVCQFALRYEYEDGEMSAISPYSGTPFNLIARNEDDLKDFTSINMVTLRNSGGKRVLVQYRSTDNVVFSERTIQLKSNFDGRDIDVDNGSRLVEACSAARDNEMVVGAIATDKNGTPFILCDKGNFYLKDGITGYCVGTAVNRDGTNAIFLITSSTNIQIRRLNMTGEYPALDLAKTIPNEGYGDYNNKSIPSQFTMHAACMNYEGNICYVLTSSGVYKTKSGGDSESSWEKKANTADLFLNAPSNVPVFPLHVCCSSDGEVVYVATLGRISVSRDSGENWKEYNIDSHSQNDITCICCSADGKRVIVSCRKKILVSNNYGADFTTSKGDYESLFETGQSQYYIYSVGCSDSGDIVYATLGMYNLSEWGGYGSIAYESKDGGKNFGMKRGLYNNYACDIFFSMKKNMLESLSSNKIINRTTDVEITYNTGGKHVKNIYLLMKSGPNMYKIAKIEKKGLPDNSEQVYLFKNQGMYSHVPSKDANKLYDNVPLRARTSAIIQNALMFGGYSDGRDSNIKVNASAEIKNVAGGRGDISLKCGAVQAYGIVYYDDFNRCSSVNVIGEYDSEKLTSDLDRPARVAQVTINHKAPDWATHYKIVRKDIALSFYGINGFDGAYAYKGKIYLDVTNSVDIVPSVCDSIELVYEPQSDSGENLGMSLPILGYEDSVSSSGEEGLPRGRYIVVADPDVDGYTKSDVASDKSKYVSSYFYLLQYSKVDGDKVYLETPFDFKIQNGYHCGNVQNQDSMQPAVCLLEGDGDVILLDNPVREINRLIGNSVFTTLGRPNGLIENFKETDRISGLCVSEPYVEDTGYNGLSSFNAGLVNYKDLDEEHGEIELIDGYDTDVDIYQKERCSRVLYKKNILTTASGDRSVSKSQDIFGEQQMYVGDWGMSTFKSFAKWGNNRYFIDSVRGVVLRKGMDGLTTISRYGLKDYFFDTLIRNSKFIGCYDPKHNSYMLGIADEMNNFLETVNGWSSFFGMNPDYIVNTTSAVYAIKGGKLYKHDAIENESTIYGKDIDVVIEFAINDYPEVLKVFNALSVDSNECPYKVEFETNGIKTEIDKSFFEYKEGVFLSYIPMGVGDGDFIMAGVCPEQYYGDKIPLINQDISRIHVGDLVYVLNVKDSIPNGEKREIGRVLEIGNGYIKIDRLSEIQIGSLIICSDVSQINGEIQRGKYMTVKMFFHPTSKLLLKSIQTDIDESKV